MTRLMLIAGILVLTTGCATHYYQVQGDSLVLYLDKPDVQEVILSCSLDDFEPHEARRVDGRWWCPCHRVPRSDTTMCWTGKCSFPPAR